MTMIDDVLTRRGDSLVENVSTLSKEKFLSIRALSYCLGFVGSSIEQLSPSSHPLGLTQAIEADSQYLPSDWIAIKSENLISEEFKQYDQIEEHMFATGMMNYMRSQLFIALMMEMEDYLNQLAQLILLAYPDKLNSEHFKVEEIKKESNALDLIDIKIMKKLMKKQHGPVRQFFNFIKDTLEIDATISNVLDERGIVNQTDRQSDYDNLTIEQFYPTYLEMKTRRDVGVHNGWRRNELYEEKIAAGIEIDPSIDDGKAFLGVDKIYFNKALAISTDLIARCNTLCKLRFDNAYRSQTPPEK